jgi:DNA modification methylase
VSHEIICGDCLEILADRATIRWDTVFADPPDNIGAQYAGYRDKMPRDKYVFYLGAWLRRFVETARTVWFSHNSRWTFEVGAAVTALLNWNDDLEAMPCVQTFTFGQHNQRDLCSGHRPLLRLRRKGAPLFPDRIRVQSWRQKHGDKRADPRGKVPSDVFDFPRVTGNSGQRRKHHPTQLHEGLVERCLKLSTPAGGSVLDPFAGTGTVMRVCKKLGLSSTSIEIDPSYCQEIAREHEMPEV